MNEGDFITRIAKAVFVGRVKNLGIPRDERYRQVEATIYAQDVARKLPGLFRTDVVRL